ncbi:24901_t:CDS:2, partial [Gigaspora rosea]
YRNIMKQDFGSSSVIDSIFGAFDKSSNNKFERMHNLILSTLDLKLLKEGKDIDLIIQNSNLLNEQQKKLQQLHIGQEKCVIKFNQIKDGIEQETLENIESLHNFQYWHQKILEATILTQQLQNNLNDLRLIQNESDLYKLRNNWIIKIDNSQFIFERKANLYEVYKEQVNKYWSKEIHQSSILTNNQRIELNSLCTKTLVTLTNRYYDEIKNEILEITDTFLLEDKEEIDRRIHLLKDKNLTNNRQTETLQQSRRGHLQIFLQTEEIANYN